MYQIKRLLSFSVTLTPRTIVNLYKSIALSMLFYGLALVPYHQHVSIQPNKNKAKITSHLLAWINKNHEQALTFLFMGRSSTKQNSYRILSGVPTIFYYHHKFQITLFYKYYHLQHPTATLWHSLISHHKTKLSHYFLSFQFFRKKIFSGNYFDAPSSDFLPKTFDILQKFDQTFSLTANIGKNTNQSCVIQDIGNSLYSDKPFRLPILKILRDTSLIRSWFQAVTQANFIHPFKFSPDQKCTYCQESSYTLQHVSLNCRATVKFRLKFLAFVYFQLMQRLWIQILVYQLHHNDPVGNEHYRQRVENLLQATLASNNLKLQSTEFLKTKNYTLTTVFNTLMAFQTVKKTWKHNSKQIAQIISFFVSKRFLKPIMAFLNTFCFPSLFQGRKKISADNILEQWIDLIPRSHFNDPHFQTFIDFGQILPHFFSFKFPNFSSPHTGYCPLSNTGYCPQPNTVALAPIGSDSLSSLILSPISMVSETKKSSLEDNKSKNIPSFVFSTFFKDKDYYKLLGMTDQQSQAETLLTQFFLHFLVYLENELISFSGKK